MSDNPVIDALLMGCSPLENVQEWVQQYKDDDEISLGQRAAIAAMEVLLAEWQKTGLADNNLKEQMAHTARMLQILYAFQGKLCIIDAILNWDKEQKSQKRPICELKKKPLSTIWLQGTSSCPGSVEEK